MQINTLDEFLQKYIEGYLFGDLNSVHDIVPIADDSNASYLMLSGLCAGIEFLGYLTGRDYTVENGRISTAHAFEDYCSEYLSPIDSRYEVFGTIGKKLIRNGIMHNFATKGIIGVTRRGDRDDTHLVRYTDEGVIIINPEYLLEDFKKSYFEDVVDRLRNDQIMRHRANRNYVALRDQDAEEITRTLRRVSGGMSNWPWLYRSIPTNDETTELIEQNGNLPIVS